MSLKPVPLEDFLLAANDSYLLAKKAEMLKNKTSDSSNRQNTWSKAYGDFLEERGMLYSQCVPSEEHRQSSWHSGEAWIVRDPGRGIDNQS